MVNDTYGKGLLSYYGGARKAKFRVWSNVAATEEWPVELFFRTSEGMSELEQLALSLCSGRVLDAGAGAGSHVLSLQDRGVAVVGLDVSAGAVEVMRQRGVKEAVQADFYAYEPGERYDTLLMLMNGLGIAGAVANLPRFFDKVRSLLLPGGVLIADSSDLSYLYQDDEGGMLVDLNADYYGELEYRMDFRTEKGSPFRWLFLDFDTLQEYASLNGFEAELLYEDAHYQYLVRLTDVKG